MPTRAGAWVSVGNTPSRSTAALPSARERELAHAAHTRTSATNSAVASSGRRARISIVGKRLRVPEIDHDGLPGNDVLDLFVGQLRDEDLPIGKTEADARQPAEARQSLDRGPNGATVRAGPREADVVRPNERRGRDPLLQMVGSCDPMRTELDVPVAGWL